MIEPTKKISLIKKVSLKKKEKSVDPQTRKQIFEESRNGTSRELGEYMVRDYGPSGY